MTSDGTMSLIRRTYSDGNNFDKPNDENENMIKSDMSFTSDGDVPQVQTESFLTIKLNPGVTVKNIIALFIAFFVM